MSTQSIIVLPSASLPVASVSPVAIEMREDALAGSALIGKVENSAQNNQCARARKEIKGIISLTENNRKTAKEPFLEAGRTVDRIAADFVEELKREDGRLENLEKDFIRAEMRRKAEEEELQRRELARIEAEKQAELLRIAREQVAAEAAAKAQVEAAAKAAREATNAIERQLAETARLEAEKAAQAAAASAAQQAQIATEQAAAASYIESKPVEIQRAFGQSVRKVWIISQINDFQLAKSRPDLIRKIEWDMNALKHALQESGGKLPGVTAREDISIGQRAGKALIEV